MILVVHFVFDMIYVDERFTFVPSLILWYCFEPYYYESDLKRDVFWDDFHRRVFALFPLCMAMTFWRLCHVDD